MARRISIQFEVHGDPSAYYSRVFDLADDLYRDIDMPGLGVVAFDPAGINWSSRTLCITVNKKCDLGEVMQIVLRHLRDHGFHSGVTVRRD